MTDQVTIPLSVLEPFLSFSKMAVDENGWTDTTQKERIVDWFGPSDFRRLTEAIQLADDNRQNDIAG